MVLVTQIGRPRLQRGLANTGTWFIGRLQTERDKARVLEGLEGVAAGSGKEFDRQKKEQTLAGLNNRVFLLNNVHEDAPEIFETRWAMSYLRGPLTRTQIKTLMEPAKDSSSLARQAAAGSAESSTSTVAANSAVRPTVAAKAAVGTGRPALPPEVSQYFIPIRSNGESGARLIYRAVILAAAEVRFTDATKVDKTQEITLVTGIIDGAVPVDWDAATMAEIALGDLEQTPQAEAQFDDLVAAAGKAKSYLAWQKDFASWVYRNQKLELNRSPSLGVASNPGESERDFRIRLQQLARERRDEAVARLREKYASKIAALQEKRRRAEQAVEREAEQAKSQKFQTAISFGATLLSSFMGRKTVSLSTLGRATTAVKGVSRTMKESADVGRAQETVAVLTQQQTDLDAQFKEEAENFDKSMDSQTEVLETVALKPTKANIAVKLFTLAWAPHWQDGEGRITPAWQ